MPLTKINLVEMIYSGLGMSKQECANVVDSVFEIMKDELSKGNDLMISGFGKWVVKKKTARVGRNPKTGEQMPIDARTVVTFKSSDKLRSEINSG
jgi:integration host factor subunit alpha